MMRKATRPRYPRINCSVPGCKRGTTTCEPPARIICGKCWRKAPKDMRERFARAWRSHRKAVKGDDERMQRVTAAWVVLAWEAILGVLSTPPRDSDEMPPLMGEALRKAGLV